MRSYLVKLKVQVLKIMRQKFGTVILLLKDKNASLNETHCFFVKIQKPIVGKLFVGTIYL